MRLLCPFCFGERYKAVHEPDCEHYWECLDCGQWFDEEDVAEYHDAVDRGEL